MKPPKILDKIAEVINALRASAAAGGHTRLHEPVLRPKVKGRIRNPRQLNDLPRSEPNLHRAFNIAHLTHNEPKYILNVPLLIRLVS